MVKRKLKNITFILFAIIAMGFFNRVYAEGYKTTKTSKMPGTYQTILRSGKFTKNFGDNNTINHMYTKDGHWAICTRRHQSNSGNTGDVQKCTLEDKGWSANDALSAGVANIILRATSPTNDAIDKVLTTERYYYADLAINQYLYNMYYNSSEKFEKNYIFGKNENPEVSISNKLSIGSKNKGIVDINQRQFIDKWTSVGEKAYNATKNFKPSVKTTKASCDDSGKCTVKFKITDNINALGSADTWASYTESCDKSNIKFISTSKTNKTESITVNTCKIENSIGTIEIQLKDDFASNDSEWEISYQVDVTRNYYKAQNYNCGKGFQTITTNELLEAKTKPTAAKGKAFVNIQKTTAGSSSHPVVANCAARVQKVSTQKNPLEGAEFVKVTSEGNIPFIPDSSNCISWTNLTVPVTIRETKAPFGYKLLSGDISIQTNPTEDITTEIENAPDTSVTIQKRDYKGNRVKGATIAIMSDNDADDANPYQWFVYLDTDEKTIVENPKPNNGIALAKFVDSSYTGKKYDRWTSSEEYDVQFIEIPYSQATKIVELSVPEGYVDDPSSGISPGIDINGNRNIKIELTNYKSDIEISKQDITTKKELPGAKMELFQKGPNGDVPLETWTSTNTPHAIKNLSNGDYYIRETSAPKGYELNTETYSFTIEKGDVSGTTVVYNTPSKVTVADTLIGKKVITYVLGSMLIIAGAGVLFYEIKKKKRA